MRRYQEQANKTALLEHPVAEAEDLPFIPSPINVGFAAELQNLQGPEDY